MKSLWQRTSELFWQYGVLWLPVLVADLISFALLSSRKALLHAAITWTLERHSVPAGAVPEISTDHAALLKAPILAGVISVMTVYLTVFVYLAALLLTSEIVRRMLGKNPVYGSEGLFKKLAILSSAVSAIALLVGICVELGTVSLLQAAHRNTWLVSPYLGQLIAFIWMLLVTFAVTPMVLRAMRRTDTVIIDSRKKRLGRQSAVLAVGASALALAFVTMARHSLLATPGQWIAVDIVASLMTAMPYIPLYIALALLADDEPQEAMIETALSGSDE